MQILVITTENQSEDWMDLHSVLHFLMDNAPSDTVVKLETSEPGNPMAYASITKASEYAVTIGDVYYNVPDGVDEVMSNFYGALV
jgi:hypothetical protein